MKVNINLNVTNKALYSLIFFLVILVSIGVYAYNSGLTPDVIGHSGEEVEITLPDESTTTLNEWIADVETKLNDPKQVITSTTDTISTLDSGKQYLVSVYGITANRGNDGATLEAVKVTTCSATPTTLETTGTNYINWHDGQAPQSAMFVVTAPSDGCIKVATDNLVLYVVALKLN